MGEIRTTPHTKNLTPQGRTSRIQNSLQQKSKTPPLFHLYNRVLKLSSFNFIQAWDKIKISQR